ncbi:MAG: hypothetical protein HYW52_08210 [Gemmatimonadetes bacterium]|nr:hypothetical protein [Gemmatimonadota bacterium]
MPHPDRRQFLSLLASAGTAAFARLGNALGVVTVAAEATPFFAHPDGQRCLVRFFVSDLDAPAGRLRAFDRARRQLGTAGVIPLGDGRLNGELWLPLGALPRIRTELEAPGLRRPVATWHALTPAPRWTIHWVTLLDPENLQQHLASLERIPRAVETATLQGIGAMVNSVPASMPTVIGDLPFLRLAEPGERVAALTGLTRGPAAAITDAELRVPSLAAVLAASGVTTILLKDAPAGGLHWLPGPQGSRLLVVAVPAGAAPERLGFREGGDRMVRSVERLLADLPVEGGAGSEGAPEQTALVVGTETEDLARAAAGVRDWNVRFTYPRIVVGDPPAFLRAAPRSYAGGISLWAPQSPAGRPVPSLAETMDHAQRRAAESSRRADAMIACLAPLVPGTGTGLERVANQLAMPVPGTLVFNPTSYARTELVRMADGSERVATDIPPLGYAYFPRGTGDGGQWRAMAEDGFPHAIQTGQFRLALDPDTGAIRSLAQPADSREWASESLGLNAVPGARLEWATREALPGVAARIIARRRAPWGGGIRTVVTVYERLPWIDIVNHADLGGDEPVAYRFGFELHAAGVEWEIPAGVERGAPPCDCAHLRWLRLTGERGSALLAVPQAAFGRVDHDGALTSYGPPGESRFRIGVSPAGAFRFREDPWRFGWGIEPVVTAPVPGTGGALLPTFGSLLVLDQPGVAIVGLQPAADGDGVIAYLQELGGLSRVATLGAGLIGFEDARQVDLVERDLGPPAMVMRNGVGLMLPAHGVAAVRLLGVTLATRA